MPENKPKSAWLNRTVLGVGLTSLFSDWSHETATAVLPAFLSLIGAGPACDGQVLVWHDLLGLYAGQAPRFVKRYAGLSEEIATALEAYVGEVRDGSFPAEQHTYSIPDAELERFDAALGERR